jgi:hypothetical protein
MVQPVHDELEVFFRDVPQVRTFGEILANQSVDIFVQASLPGTIRVGEINLGLEFSGDGFMVGKFSAVVGGEGMDPASMRTQSLDHLLLHRLGGFLSYLAEQGKLTFTFDQADHGATMMFADKGVGLPVAQAFFGFDDLRTLFDPDAIGYFAPEITFSSSRRYEAASRDRPRRPDPARGADRCIHD